MLKPHGFATLHHSCIYNQDYSYQWVMQWLVARGVHGSKHIGYGIPTYRVSRAWGGCDMYFSRYFSVGSMGQIGLFRKRSKSAQILGSMGQATLDRISKTCPLPPMLPRPWRSRRAWCQVLRGGTGANGPGAHVLKGPGPAAKYLAPSMLGRPWSREHGYKLHIPMFSKTRALF